MAEQKIRVLLVDDHKIFVEGVANLLSDQKDIEVAGLKYNGLSALDFLREKPTDLVLTDIQMPGLNGIELTQKIKEEFPEIRIIALSMFDKKEIINELITSGAEGYLLKDIEKSELLKAIRNVVAGEYYYSSSIANILIKKLRKKIYLPREKEKLLS